LDHIEARPAALVTRFAKLLSLDLIVFNYSPRINANGNRASPPKKNA
jgi:hypothetical protein